MKIRLTLNGKKIEAEIKADTLLLDLVREKGCYSVKRGCETSNCGLCTVWLDGKPVLSCSVLAARAFRKSQRNLLIFWQEKARTSAASAVLVSS